MNLLDVFYLIDRLQNRIGDGAELAICGTHLIDGVILIIRWPDDATAHIYVEETTLLTQDDLSDLEDSIVDRMRADYQAHKAGNE